jgi:hypothetical protein
VWVKRAGRWQVVASHGSDTSDVEAEAIQKITRLHKEWDSTGVRGDVNALGLILGGEYIGTSPEGEIETKATILADIKNAPVWIPRVG